MDALSVNAHAGAGEARLAKDHFFAPRTWARLLEYRRDVVRL